MNATKISYQKKGPKFLMGLATDWIYVEELFSDDRLQSLRLLESFGAIRNVSVR